MGYEVFSEVTPRAQGGKRADIVALQPDTVTIVELKLSLSIELLEQAIYWITNGFANYVYIAVPVTKKKYIDSWLINDICKRFGIGVLFIDKNELDIINKPIVEARYNRIKNTYFRKTIEKYKYDYEKNDLKGGHSGGGYVSAYRSTMDKVKELLKQLREGKRARLYWYENGETICLQDKCDDGWLDIKTILDYCETHYSSPKSSLSKALRVFENDWCECEKINGKLHFRYKA